MKPNFIAIDGAVATGKTTVGKLLAKRLGYKFIDTGLMYRALAHKALKLRVVEDKKELVRIARSIDFLFRGDELMVDGRMLKLRSLEVERWVSAVSAVPEVREILVAKQRELAKGGGVVMVGRDIGTVVLPEAEIKVFLTASVEERARRRFRELNGQIDYQVILKELLRRDEIDSQRDVSPLKPAPDAYILDTEHLSPEEVVDKILSLTCPGFIPSPSG